jgi:4,5-dihydroxyphthalate decarboxylase
MTDMPVLSLAIQRFDRTEALHDGRVRAPGIHVSHVLPAVGVHGLLQGAFDAAEMPLAHYVLLRALGEPFTGIPVFPDRLFLHQYVYTMPGSGITGLADLKGRRVGVPMYFMTSSVWHRGFLQEATGIAPAEIDWVTTAPERDHRAVIPSDVSVTIQPGSHLGLERLLNGDVDCLMTEATPPMTAEEARTVVPVHAAAHAAQVSFFRERAIHPIVHVIAIREEALTRRPDAVQTLSRAFDESLQAAYDLLENERMVALPLMRSYLDETAELFGDDPWPYGLRGRNVTELETFLGFAWEQGLTPRRLQVDQLFHSAADDYEFQARTRKGADLGSLRSLRGVRGDHVRW